MVADNGRAGDPSGAVAARDAGDRAGGADHQRVGGSWSDSTTSINVWWTASPSNGGTPVTGYRVSTYADGRTVPVQVSALLPASDPRNLTVSGLVTNATYRVVVVAYNAVGASVPSALSAPVTAH